MATASGHLSDWIDFRNGKSSPERTDSGEFPVFGSNGQIGRADRSNVKQSATVIGRVGSFCGSTWYSPGPAWVTDNAIIATATNGNESRFWYYVLRFLNLNRLSQGSGQPLLNQSILKSIPFAPPPHHQRIEIAETLGALDDKIESNRRQRALLREIGLSRYKSALQVDSRAIELDEATLSIARGVTPRYADEDPRAPLVINQKCIRDGWVSLEPARRMLDRVVKVEKRASSGDILVNSTGTGTLGRVARWHSGDIFVDGHVSVVKPDPSVVSPAVLAYALIGREVDIEDLATGSTGQTELSASRLGQLLIDVPSPSQSSDLEEALMAIESRCQQLTDENQRLETIRDTLLPELLSGRLRVPVESS